VSCLDDRALPVLDLDGDHIPAAISSPLSGNLGTLDSDNPDEILETFTWDAANFGAGVPVRYTLQMALGAPTARTGGNGEDDPFATTVTVGTTSNTELAVTIDQFNSAMLALGADEGVQYTVYLRVRAEVIGQPVEPVYSETMTRTATPYRLSNCGTWCSMAIIGGSTPGGWGTDTDMWLSDPDGLDLHSWRVILYLNVDVDGAKFRTRDGWNDNWGGSGLSGTAVPGGGNISIATAGWYRVEFNDQSLEYSFALLSPNLFVSCGIIGDATPGGWGSDTALDDLGGQIFQAGSAISFTQAESKFRELNNWDKNWGGNTFPSGLASPGGPNIPTSAGNYFPRINTVSGQYWFMLDDETYDQIGIVGGFSDWGNDVFLIKDPTNPYRFSGYITLEEDTELKFRANGEWANNWGSSTFPSGLANGAGNIQAKAGTYFVTFNTGTLEFNFLK
jgi:starch-binding outer membrane protein SusE/F